MDKNAKLSHFTTLFSIVLELILATAPASSDTTHAMSSDKVVNFKFNNLYSDIFLYDGDAGTQGYLNVGLLSESNNAGLDFGYSVPDVTNPDFLIIYQGAGEIPGDAFTITSTSAHLSVTTPASFYVHRCIVNIITAEYYCTPTDPITFDLTWVTDGLFSVSEKFERTETYVASIIRYKGEYSRLSGTVKGTWGDGFITENMAGSLLDSKNKEFYRDITLKTNP